MRRFAFSLACVQCLAVAATLPLNACKSNQLNAAQFQYARVGDLDKPDSAFGFSLQRLGDEAFPVGWFADMRLGFAGGVEGLRYDDEPSNASTHPVTDTASGTASAHIGPTVRAMDNLWFHAGVGIGYEQGSIERYDASNTLSPDGYYNYPTNATIQGSMTAGTLWMPTEGIMLGLGYDLYFDAVVFGVGITF